MISMGLAVLITFTMESIFCCSRSSDLASRGYLEVWTELCGAVREIFDLKQETVSFHKEALLDKIDTCASLGRQAASEMRWWRTDWPGPLFEGACSSARQ